MLSVESMSCGYPKHPVLHGFDLKVGAGECHAVLGRNGVGKTTLVRALIGEIRPSSGSIDFNGHNISRHSPQHRVKAGIAHVPQGRGIISGLTVLDNLRVPLAAARVRRWRSRVDSIIDDFPLLRGRMDDQASSLSGGQQQLLSLARALLTDPEFLILDEPSEGVQPSLVEAMAATLARIREETGITILLVEQNLSFAASVAERCSIIDHGEIVAELATSELAASRELQQQYLAL